ncbi:MAG: carboxypeptidase regulatory-like domain-containing protein [Planctomycetes bacterium]|nr:carboxypeptidase regulatory-like domain-containing protein [Planctomycetota bacterium]
MKTIRRPLSSAIAGGLLLGACCLPLLAGCGQGNPLEREAVSGAVTLDEKPLSRGNIEFAPIETGGVSSGTAISDGRYQIERIKGLPPGKYRVRIFAAQENTAPPTPEEAALPAVHRPGVEQVAPRFNTASELDAEITAGGKNECNFDVFSK